MKPSLSCPPLPLALSLVALLLAPAPAAASPDQARLVLEQALAQVEQLVIPVAAEAAAAEALRQRAETVDHDIAVWYYRDRDLPVLRLPEVVPDPLLNGWNPPTEAQLAVALFLEAAPKGLQDEVNRNVGGHYSAGYSGAGTYASPASHSLGRVQVGPPRIDDPPPPALEVLLPRVAARRQALEAAVAAAEAFTPEIEDRSWAPNVWTNEEQWPPLEAAYVTARDAYHEDLKALRQALFLAAHEALATRLRYEDYQEPGKGLFGVKITVTRTRVYLRPDQGPTPQDPGTLADQAAPGFDDLRSSGQAAAREAGRGEFQLEGEPKLTALLPESVRASIDYRERQAYQDGAYDAYLEAQRKAEEEAEEEERAKKAAEEDS